MALIRTYNPLTRRYEAPKQTTAIVAKASAQAIDAQWITTQLILSNQRIKALEARLASVHSAKTIKQVRDCLVA